MQLEASFVAACGLLSTVASGLWSTQLQYLLHVGLAALGMWHLSSQPGIEPMSPALESRFLTMGPPGKSPRQVVLQSQRLLGYKEL